MLQGKGRSHQAFAPDPLPWLTRTLVEFWSVRRDTTPLQVVLDGGLRAYHDPFQRSLYDILTSPLDAEERRAKDGYLYAYEVEGSPGFIKIGYTSRSVDIRHAEWTDDCNRRATLLYPLEDDEVERVPNARRIEALCHAVLHAYRRRIDCSACRRQHIECFEVAVDKAIQTIRDCLESEILLRDKWGGKTVDEQSFWDMVSNIESLTLKD